MSESTPTLKAFTDTLDETLARVTSKCNSQTPEQREAERKERERRSQEYSTMRMREVMDSARVPKRQRLNRELDRSGQWEETRKKIADRLGTGFLIALVGVRGSGKTQIGVELIRQLAKDLKRSRFCSAMEFFMAVKSGYKEDGEPEEEIIQQFSRFDLLVMDEIGQRSDSEWENRLLYELLNRRYNAIQDTLLISNQDLTQLEKALGPSLVSRMRETGGVIECNWASYRK